MHSRAWLPARPEHLPVIHRSTRATCRLSTSAVEGTTSTPLSCPNPVAEYGSKLPRAGWRCFLRITANWVFTGQGSTKIFNDDPPCNNRLCRGFTPTWSTQTPPVTGWCQRHVEVRVAKRPRGAGLFRTNSPRFPAPKCASPFRAASHAFSRKKTQAAAPEVLSTITSPRKRRGYRFTTDRSIAPQSPKTFFTGSLSNPDEVGGLLARLPWKWRALALPLRWPPQSP